MITVICFLIGLVIGLVIGFIFGIFVYADEEDELVKYEDYDDRG